jgi:hypothetical protein
LRLFQRRKRSKNESYIKKKRFHEFKISLKLGKNDSKKHFFFFFKSILANTKTKTSLKVSFATKPLINERSNWKSEFLLFSDNCLSCFWLNKIFRHHHRSVYEKYFENWLCVNNAKGWFASNESNKSPFGLFFHWLQLWLPHCSLIFLQSRQYLIEFIQTFVQKKTISKF